MEEHVEHLCKEFKVLCDNNLCVKQEKCSFAQPTVQFLEHTIILGELTMDYDKVEVVRDWETQTKVPELRSNLGLANYYWRFIFCYSTIVFPRNDLLKKSRDWE